MTFAAQARRRRVPGEEALYEVLAETAGGGERHVYLVVASSEQDAEASLPGELCAMESRCCGSAPMGVYGIVGWIVLPGGPTSLPEPRGRSQSGDGADEPAFGMLMTPALRQH